MIIDAHAHIMLGVKGQTATGATTSLSWGRVRWGDDTIQLLPPYCEATSFSAETLLAQMDWAGVERAVLLQGPFYGEANAYVASAVKRWPDRFTGAFAPDPRQRDVREQFKQCVDEYGLRVLKFELTEATGLTGRYPDLDIDSAAFQWLYEEAEKRKLVVTFDLGKAGSASYQTDNVAAVARRNPALNIVIAHLGQPPIATPDDDALNEAWTDQILLGRLPNVFFDTSALPAYAPDYDEYPYVQAQGYIRRAVELIGADKIMWGTDVPGLLTSGSYRQLLNMIRVHCDFLSAEQKAQILGANAARVYWSA
ncbi:MAG: amidohydrolase family protein [Chloroflexi bacterium]|nr:amidohydrolase family protein [Chloroflexota bacterium]